MANTTVSTLPPDLFDQTTLISLASTVVLVAVAYGASLKALSPTTSGSMRFLFIWHAFDALTHFILEGGFLYHCFFSWLPVGDVTLKELREQKYFTTPHGFLGHTDRVYGSQAGGDNPLAQLWMVYAKADKRWAGVDLVSPTLHECVDTRDRQAYATRVYRASSASSCSQYLSWRPSHVWCATILPRKTLVRTSS